MLAFDPENVTCYRKNLKLTLIAKKLRKVMRITSICPMDEFDSTKNRTKEGSHLMRYLYGTECGDLYMIAFDLRNLSLMSSLTEVNQFEAGKFLIIEYLGGNLSECQSLSYLSNGYVFYGSRLGDSHILKL